MDLNGLKYELLNSNVVILGVRRARAFSARNLAFISCVTMHAYNLTQGHKIHINIFLKRVCDKSRITD